MDQVEEVKHKTDIVAIVGEKVQLKKAGRNYKALCPFHGEKTPSFMVSPELQIYKCFGCGAAGDVFSFLQRFEGIEFYEALEDLAKRAGVKLRPMKGKRDDRERLVNLNENALNFYRYVLTDHPAGKKALAYLTQKRGLKLDTIKTFNLGFAPDDGRSLVSYLTNKKKFAPNEIVKAGIAYAGQSGELDRFRGRVIFPLHNHRGVVVGFAGRLLPGDEKKPLAKYINTPETDLYHKSRLLYGFHLTKSEIKEQNRAVIVEGELDVISSWQAGIEGAVAIKGSALTEDQAKLLIRITDRLVLALDADFAGDTALRRGIKVAQNAGFDIRVCSLGRYKDPDEIARKNPKLFKKFLKKAKNIWDYYLEAAFSKCDLRTGEGKAKVSRELVPIIAAIPDSIVQAHYVKKTANKLDVPVQAVFEEIGKVKIEKEYQKKIEPVAVNRRQLLEERITAILINFHFDLKRHPEVLKLVANNLFRRILTEYRKHDEDKDFDLSKFAKGLPEELFEGLSKLVMSEYDWENYDREKAKNELEKSLISLKALVMREELTGLGKQIKRFEQEKNQKKLIASQKRFSAMANELSELEEE